MSSTPPGADVRGFYQAVGIELPGWAHTEAPVRCFADPAAHAHTDRDPSCSVNLDSGAYNCHGCGAHGGAYDAALAIGHSPRDAIELMITHGLTERRARDDRSRTISPARARDPAKTSTAPTSTQAARGTRREAPAAATEARRERLPPPPVSSVDRRVCRCGSAPSTCAGARRRC